MITHEGVTRALRKLYNTGLNFPPGPRAELEEIALDWLDVLDDPAVRADSQLTWAVKRWQKDGNERWPKPEQLVRLIADENNRVAAQVRQEQADDRDECRHCRSTGTRYVITHTLKMRYPAPNEDAPPLDPADVDAVVRLFNSPDLEEQRSAWEWVASASDVSSISIRTAVCSCTCTHGARLNPERYPSMRCFSEMIRPVKHLPPGQHQGMRGIAQRVYVTATKRRLIADDARIGGMFLCMPSPEEERGLLRGPELRRDTMSVLARQWGMGSQQPDRHAGKRARSNRRRLAEVNR